MFLNSEDKELIRNALNFHFCTAKTQKEKKLQLKTVYKILDTILNHLEKIPLQEETSFTEAVFCCINELKQDEAVRSSYFFLINEEQIKDPLKMLSKTRRGLVNGFNETVVQREITRYFLVNLMEYVRNNLPISERNTQLLHSLQKRITVISCNIEIANIKYVLSWLNETNNMSLRYKSHILKSTNLFFSVFPKVSLLYPLTYFGALFSFIHSFRSPSQWMTHLLFDVLRFATFSDDFQVITERVGYVSLITLFSFGIGYLGNRLLSPIINELEDTRISEERILQAVIDSFPPNDVQMNFGDDRFILSVKQNLVSSLNLSERVIQQLNF
ncbi:hypothetical protein [Legionella parisiensis]|nr:hypothetical protein [Legionella parisiensis]KTD40123.1 hypothetical protein Lpar_1440 [Legionella parisiensis]STX77332.1 Uncharacterised protein [Legionella parisiensis]